MNLLIIWSRIVLGEFLAFLHLWRCSMYLIALNGFQFRFEKALYGVNSSLVDVLLENKIMYILPFPCNISLASRFTPQSAAYFFSRKNFSIFSILQDDWRFHYGEKINDSEAPITKASVLANVKIIVNMVISRLYRLYTRRIFDLYIFFYRN